MEKIKKEGFVLFFSCLFLGLLAIGTGLVFYLENRNLLFPVLYLIPLTGVLVFTGLLAIGLAVRVFKKNIKYKGQKPLFSLQKFDKFI